MADWRDDAEWERERAVRRAESERWRQEAAARRRVERRARRSKEKPLDAKVEQAALEEVQAVYERYRAGALRREPCLTVTMIAEAIEHRVDPAFRYATKRRQVGMTGNALARLKRKGRLGSSLGIGLTGRGARCWEPPA